MEYNNEFKEIDTEEKAYFLGFMYADGCLSAIKRKNSKYIKYQVQISLTDETVIMEFLKHFPFFNLQIFDFGKYKPTWSKQFALRKANKELFEDLLSHGILQRKSGKNGKKAKVPKLRKDLQNHFIRGFFDGDGSVYYSTKRSNIIRSEICCSSKELLKELQDLLEENGVKCPVFREKHNNKSPLYVLEWFTSDQTLKLSEFLYKNSTISLNRKKEKFESFNLVFRKMNNPKCECGELLTKRGTRQTKKGLSTRYKCEKCNKNFTHKAQIKQGELLETPTLERQKEDNQQPSLSSNTLEGSTTNSQILSKDGNANTSALPKSIIEIGKPYSDYLHNKTFGDDIV